MLRRSNLFGGPYRGRVGGDDGRDSDLRVRRREYGLSESAGEEADRVSFDNLERQYNDLNEVKNLSPLFEKVANPFI